MWLSDDILIHNPPDDDSIDILIDRVFPDLVANCTSATYMRERVRYYPPEMNMLIR